MASSHSASAPAPTYQVEEQPTFIESTNDAPYERRQATQEQRGQPQVSVEAITNGPGYGRTAPQPDRSIMNRPNNYGDGSGVPVAPVPQDVRMRYGADGRYAQPQPSQRTTDHR